MPVHTHQTYERQDDGSTVLTDERTEVVPGLRVLDPPTEPGQDRPTIAADGTEAATVEYTHPDPTGQVTLDANGVQETLDVAEHTAATEVTASEPGTITVTVGDYTTTIEAE